MTSGAAAPVRPEPLIEFAPAKINLYLHVTGRRPDGYHSLESLVVFANVGDSLELTPAADFTLDLAGPYASALDGGADNLVLKAARLLADATATQAGAHLRLTKRLPVASGIGGGSADAAAALRGLIRLWGLVPAPALVSDLALRLGADVPVCIARQSTQIEGLGESLNPAPRLPGFWLVLVNCGIGLATANVFKARTGAFLAADPLTEPPRDIAALAVALARRRNDLTSAAIGLVPEIGVTLAAIEAQPGCMIARMSGSGATCFGLFGEEDSARSAARALAARHPSWWVVAASDFGGSAPG
jgi:4-diphosphocytidyl-2-C-methyl-D-erythritol kinase